VARLQRLIGDRLLVITCPIRVGCAASGFESMLVLVVSVSEVSGNSSNSFVESVSSESNQFVNLEFHEHKLRCKSIARSSSRVGGCHTRRLGEPCSAGWRSNEGATEREEVEPNLKQPGATPTDSPTDSELLTWPGSVAPSSCRSPIRVMIYSISQRPRRPGADPKSLALAGL
jgi:hypothetical protein